MPSNTTFSSRQAIDPRSAARMDTESLRENFHIGGLFQPDAIKLTYTHYDRMVVGGAMPVRGALSLEPVRPMGAAGFLDRRELIAVNIGGAGTVTTSVTKHALGHRDMIYVGKGESVGLASDSADDPAKFYLLSAPAHQAHPTTLLTIDRARRLDLGSQATSNERSIFQFTTPDAVRTCQLMAGMTQLAPGSVWNTMPCHVHDRRMEVYLYFGLDEAARVFHFLGEPSQTRHIVAANEEAVLSPPWSIHCGCGTGSYTFIWAMAGDNVDYSDVDPVPMEISAMTDLSAFSLAGRRILVTGANTGIGQGIAVSIAKAGGEVVAVGRSSLDETLARIDAVGGKAAQQHCDLADIRAVKSLIGDVWREIGPLDGLVNNAGIIRRQDSVDLTEADWDDVIDLNLKVAFLLSQAFGRQAMQTSRPGRIVNIASLLSFQGGIRVASYTASKHGILGVTRVLANEWAARNINVNAIAPGYVVSNNTEALRADEERSAAILARIPAGRWGRPDDIGDAAVFLLAPASNYMHGAIIPVDGGWLAR